MQVCAGFSVDRVVVSGDFGGFRFHLAGAVQTLSRERSAEEQTSVSLDADLIATLVVSAGNHEQLATETDDALSADKTIGISCVLRCKQTASVVVQLPMGRSGLVRGAP